MPTFAPRTEQVKFTGNPLFKRMHFDRGFALLKNGTRYREVRNPSNEDIAEADVAYLGGRAYTVSTDEAAALTAAGYTVT